MEMNTGTIFLLNPLLLEFVGGIKRGVRLRHIRTQTIKPSNLQNNRRQMDVDDVNPQALFSLLEILFGHVLL